ncbi:hypothetical protein [Flavobacterium branchiophilum]|nr:hypothetical protein [Flavobacterium branchiophilum]
MTMYDNQNTFEKSFDKDYLTEDLIQAQWAEFIELKKIITKLYIQKGSPITILDLGIGNARIPKHLSGIDEIWSKIAQYDGTDNAMACVELSNKVLEALQIHDKAKAYWFDAKNLSQWQGKYDLIITTWFTAGNFYPENFSFEDYSTHEAVLDLSMNPTFDTIFKAAYQILQPNGAIVLGACYKDNQNTRLKQEKAYLKMGMHVITTHKDSFTATKEGFWSQRFTTERIYNYFNYVNKNKITFTDLDTYEYAMQVIISK